MLILSRKMGESIIIGDEVKVTILGISGKTIKVGIDAPLEISVHRQEIHQKLEDQQAHNDRLRNSRR